jgi:hypothetical protein
VDVVTSTEPRLLVLLIVAAMVIGFGESIISAVLDRQNAPGASCPTRQGQSPGGSPTTGGTFDPRHSADH